MLGAIADAVDAPADTADAVTEALRGAPAVLVVDNLEHLDGVGDVLVDLLGRLDTLRALATSRAPLRVLGEHEWPVRTLEVPSPDITEPAALLEVPSVGLLVDRVRAAVPGFALTADVAPQVGEICRRLDGIPLALELAAGQWRVRGASGVLEAIERDPLGLRDLGGAHPDHHASVRTALAASYLLLDDDAQPALHAIAALRGAWTIEAATAVTGSERIVEYLDQFVALGLVEAAVTGADPRFSMLPTIRTYVAEQAAGAGDADAAAARHAHYFQRWAAGFDSELQSGSRQAVERLDADLSNLRAALDWFDRHDAEGGLKLASSLYRYWMPRARYDEGIAYLEAFVGRAQAGADRAYAGLAAANLAANAGRDGLARRLAEESLDEYRGLGDQRGCVLALGTLGLIRADHTIDLAVGWCREAADLAASIGDVALESWTLGNLGAWLLVLGNPAEALPVMERGLALARETGNTYREATFLETLGEARFLLGDLVAADRNYAEAEPLTRAAGHVERAGGVFAGWAVVALGLGDVDRARRLADEAWSSATEAGTSDTLGLALWARAELAVATGGDPVPDFREALHHSRAHAQPLFTVQLLSGLAAATDDAETAALAHAAVVSICTRHDMTPPEGIASRLEADLRRWSSGADGAHWNRLVREYEARPLAELIDTITTG